MSKKKEEQKNDMVESIFWRDMEYTCPVRGKVTQKVKVITYKSKKIEVKDFVKSSDVMVNDFDMSELIDIDDDASQSSLHEVDNND